MFAVGDLVRFAHNDYVFNDLTLGKLYEVEGVNRDGLVDCIRVLNDRKDARWYAECFFERAEGGIKEVYKGRFNVGDKVRFKNWDLDMTQGAIYEVIKVEGSFLQGAILIVDDAGDRVWYRESNFELVEEEEEEPESLFKAGDKARCIDVAFDGLTLGKIYEIRDANAYCVHIKDDRGLCINTEPDYFELVDIEKEAMNISVKKEMEVPDETATVASDPTYHPSHYTQGSIEPLDFIIDQKMDFLEGNIIKYVSRYKFKNGLADLKKAQFYLERLIIEIEERGYHD